jgi:hypothetical protein
MGGGLESRCVGRVCGADGFVRSCNHSFSGKALSTTYSDCTKVSQ